MRSLDSAPPLARLAREAEDLSINRRFGRSNDAVDRHRASPDESVWDLASTQILRHGMKQREH